jgi:hypothetical protein
MTCRYRRAIHQRWCGESRPWPWCHEYLEEKAVWVELTGGTRDPFTLG